MYSLEDMCFMIDCGIIFSFLIVAIFRLLFGLLKDFEQIKTEKLKQKEIKEHKENV